ncbi:MAG: urease accessory UreF family protein [Pseudomonadota bacterium]
MTQSHLKLTRLLQLASPALPVGAYSYSQGLESAIESRLVHDEATTLAWITDVLELTVAQMEAPLFLRLHAAWGSGDERAAQEWNEMFVASRETAELRAETLQMGYSLARLLGEVGQAHPFATWEDVSMPAAFTWWAARCDIAAPESLVAYLWSWAENQVVAAMKAVPLGQSAGQRMLLTLGLCIAEQVARAQALADEALGGLAPALAMLSSQHETQYSRLFRS